MNRLGGAATWPLAARAQQGERARSVILIATFAYMPIRFLASALLIA
jgi:hypothetical protein